MIYFKRLKNWTKQEQCKVCQYGHFRVNLFSCISFSLENQKSKLLVKINWSTVLCSLNMNSYLNVQFLLVGPTL